MEADVHAFRIDYVLPFPVDTYRLAEATRNSVYHDLRGYCQIYLTSPVGLVTVYSCGLVKLQGLKSGRYAPPAYEAEKDFPVDEFFSTYLQTFPPKELMESEDERQQRFSLIPPTLVLDYDLARRAIQRLLHHLGLVFPERYDTPSKGIASFSPSPWSLLFDPKRLRFCLFVSQTILSPAPHLTQQKKAPIIDLHYLAHNASFFFPAYPLEIPLPYVDPTTSEQTSLDTLVAKLEREVSSNPCVVSESINYVATRQAIHLKTRPILEIAQNTKRGYPYLIIRTVGEPDQRPTCREKKDLGNSVQVFVDQASMPGVSTTPMVERERRTLANVSAMVHTSGRIIWRASSLTSLQTTMRLFSSNLRRAIDALV